MNGEIRGDQIVTRSYVNLGFAVELDDGKGLIVPVLKNAEEKNLLGIAQGRSRTSPSGRATRSCFPTTSRAAPSRSRTPAATAPSTARRSSASRRPRSSARTRSSSGRGSSQDELGQDVIAIRPIMNLTLTYDHRLVDGAYAGRVPARPAGAARDMGRIGVLGRGQGGLPPQPRARPLPGGLGSAALARCRRLAGGDPGHGDPPRASAGDHARPADGRRRAARARGRRGRDRRDRPGRQVDLPRAGPARLLSDPRPRPGTARTSSATAATSRRRHPDARGLRASTATRIDGLTGVWLTPPPRKIASIGVHIAALGDDARLRAQRRPRSGAVHAVDHGVRARGRRVHDVVAGARPAGNGRRGASARGGGARGGLRSRTRGDPGRRGRGLWPQPVHAKVSARPTESTRAGEAQRN